MHAFGRNAGAVVNRARHQVASLLGADDGEVIFTSGGSESDNTVFSIVRDIDRWRFKKEPHGDFHHRASGDH